MRAKPMLLLAVALGCGLVAMLGVQQVMSSPQAEEKEGPEMIKVMVATKDIDRFGLLDDSNTEFKEVFAKDAPEGTITSRADVENFAIRYGAVKGDYILKSKLTDKNHKPSKEIPDGMRVVTVSVNQTKTHSGLLRPGDHVDVVLTYKFNGPSREAIQRTVTLLQDVEVFASDNVRRSTFKNEDGSEIKAKNVSLLASPEHANMLMLAESRGQLTLSLRKEGDHTKIEAKPIEDSALGGIGSRPQDASIGLTEQPKDPGTIQPPPNNGGFGSFLAGNTNGGNKGDNGDGGQKSEQKPVEQPKWKLTIYTGSSKREELVELPEAPESDKKGQKSPKKGSLNPSVPPVPPTGA